MNKFTLLFSTLPLALGGLCGCRSVANPLQAERTPTTTPIVRRLAGATTSPAGSVAVVNLGSLSWSKISNNRYYTGYFAGNDKALKPSGPSIRADIICSQFTTRTSSQVYNNTFENSIGMDDSGNLYVFITSDYYENHTTEQFKAYVAGDYLYYKLGQEGESADRTIFTQGYNAGYEAGYEAGYAVGHDDGVLETGELIVNGQYTGLTIFPRRDYLEKLAKQVMEGGITPDNGSLDLIDTNGNYAINIRWTYDDDEKITIFKDLGNTQIGQLDWGNVATGVWATSWFYKYDQELHYFARPITYAGQGPIKTSFYPEVYICSTFTGYPNEYFSGGGNAYQMGFADGQTQTIEASTTYNNVFTIFTPAFRAVADFFNLNIGPFKIWYFFAIPLIITLLILVLRLVKH